MLKELTGNLTGFHTLSHLSFILFNKYPIYKTNTCLYGLLGFSDFFTHLLIYYDTKSIRHFILSIYHVLKMNNYLLRKNKVINFLDFFNYFYTYDKYYKDYYYGLLIYIIFKYHKFIW